mgnify:FL=1
MSEGTQEAFFLDTNALIKWVFEGNTPEGRALREFVKSKARGRCFVLGESLSELKAIVYDAYNIAARMVYDVVASREDWDRLGAGDRLRALEEVLKDFGQAYERVRYTHFRSYVPPGGIRQDLARRLFAALVQRVVGMNSKDIKGHLASRERAIDVVDFVNDAEFVIRRTCTVLDDVRAFVDRRTLVKLTLLYEGVRKYIRKLESQGFSKTPSLVDRTVLVELFLLADRGAHGKVVLVTDDLDFKRMYRAVLDYLDDIVSGRADPRGQMREIAEGLRHVLVNRLEIRETREVVAKP